MQRNLNITYRNLKDSVVNKEFEDIIRFKFEKKKPFV